MSRYFILIIILIQSVFLLAQDVVGEQVLQIDLVEIVIFQEYKIENRKEEKKYKILEDDLDKIYPLLVIVKTEYERINRELELYEGDREKKFLKWYENYAKESYLHHLSVLNARQARLFLKMISRELDKTPYKLIKQYRNGFQAVLWQLTANLYFTNLNTKYNREDNPMIEHIMSRIENT